MQTARYVTWKSDDMYVGHFEDFPDYMTQGTKVEELEANLRDLHKDLNNGEIPDIRRVA